MHKEIYSNVTGKLIELSMAMKMGLGPKQGFFCRFWVSKSLSQSEMFLSHQVFEEIDGKRFFGDSLKNHVGNKLDVR